MIFVEKVIPVPTNIFIPFVYGVIMRQKFYNFVGDFCVFPTGSGSEYVVVNTDTKQRLQLGKLVFNSLPANYYYLLLLLETGHGQCDGSGSKEYESFCRIQNIPDWLAA